MYEHVCDDLVCEVISCHILTHTQKHTAVGCLGDLGFCSVYSVCVFVFVFVLFWGVKQVTIRVTERVTEMSGVVCCSVARQSPAPSNLTEDLNLSVFAVCVCVCVCVCV